MATKMLLTSRSFSLGVTKLICCSSSQNIRSSLQQVMSSSSSSTGTIRALSYISSMFLGNRSSVTKNETSRSASSFYLCGNPIPGTVLVGDFNPAVVQVRNYQNKLRPRLICEGCYFTWRHGRRYVECSDYPGHKQTKKIAPRKVWREDYSKGNIQKAMDWHKRFPREFLRTADKKIVSHNWLAEKLGKEI